MDNARAREIALEGSNSYFCTVAAYNCARSTSACVSPCFSYVWQASKTDTGCSLQSKISRPGYVNTEKYMNKLRSYLKWAYKVTCGSNLKEIRRHKRRYDKDIRCTKLEPGYLVLIRQKVFGQKT